MKSVRSIADLKALSLRTGAAVEVGARRFNSDGKVVTVPRPREAPAPAADSLPVSASPANTDLHAIGEAIGKSILLALQAAQAPRPVEAQPVAVEAPAVAEPASPANTPSHPLTWRFHAERDDMGRLTQIVAEAPGTDRRWRFTPERDERGRFVSLSADAG